MRKILITGHTGYIGTNLWEYFKYDTDYQVNGIDQPFDLCKSSTNLPDVDYVIHLAAHTGVRDSLEKPREYFDNNIISTREIFNRYGSTTTKILFASTSAVKELASPYAMSKYACELIAPWNSIIMRFFTVYGGLNYRKNMLYGLAKDDKLEYITDQSRDYTHVDEVCRAVKLIMEEGQCGEIYEVGHGNPIHNRDFLKQIGYRKKLPVKEVTGESISTCADNSKLRALGW
jgi:nucleoside-diphosphate-sugar epimerase